MKKVEIVKSIALFATVAAVATVLVSGCGNTPKNAKPTKEDLQSLKASPAELAKFNKIAVTASKESDLHAVPTGTPPPGWVPPKPGGSK